MIDLSVHEIHITLKSSLTHWKHSTGQLVLREVALVLPGQPELPYYKLMHQVGKLLKKYRAVGKHTVLKTDSIEYAVNKSHQDSLTSLAKYTEDSKADGRILFSSTWTDSAYFNVEHTASEILYSLVIERVVVPITPRMSNIINSGPSYVPAPINP